MNNEKKDKNKKAIVFVRPQPGQTEDDVVNALSSPIIDEINRQRAERGLPPLPEE